MTPAAPPPARAASRPAPPAHDGRGGEPADASVATGYRRFLLGTAAAIHVGAALELGLVGHYEGWTQVLPFVLIAINLAALFWASRATRRPGATGAGRSLAALRAASALVVVGAAAGVVLHIRGNFAFEREIHPAAPLAVALWEAARGASPLLAPGALAVAGVVAAAATWRHPALADQGGAAGRGGP